jgi:hypothetical protein
MSKSIHSESGTRFSQARPLLQLFGGVTLVFLLAFGADALLQRDMGFFLAGIMEQDAFFTSVVRQQDAFAQNILGLLTLLSLLAIAVGFAGTLLFFSLLYFGRSRSTPASQFEAAQLLKTTLLSLRAIATVTFIFLVVTAIYEVLLRIISNQPPFFLLAALVIAMMYIFILAYLLFDYVKELRAGLGSRKQEAGRGGTQEDKGS